MVGLFIDFNTIIILNPDLIFNQFFFLPLAILCCQICSFWGAYRHSAKSLYTIVCLELTVNHVIQGLSGDCSSLVDLTGIRRNMKVFFILYFLKLLQAEMITRCHHELDLKCVKQSETGRIYRFNNAYNARYRAIRIITLTSCFITFIG